MYAVRPVSTSLLTDEIAKIDDYAVSQGVRRSHITRSMLRFALANMSQYEAWLDETDGRPIASPVEPT